MSRPDPMQPRATILMPAFNEESVIARGLSRLARDARPGEFQVIVICNGCNDRTAEVAGKAYPGAQVIETAVPGRTSALDLGHAAARGAVRIYLDADLEVEVADLRALVRPIEAGYASASCGRMTVDLSTSSAAVKAFYRVWALNPYFAAGKFGGIFALSAAQADRLHPLPAVTADDEFIRRSIGAGETAPVETCTFTVRAPRTLRDLLKIRRRSLRGVRELDRQGLHARGATGARSGASTLKRLLSRPALWASAIVYYAVSIGVRAALAVENPTRAPRWERDDSSRSAA